jgi:acetylornithine deacetylase/succinyl-diaminopimelate desuccinylase-like protein
MVTPVPEELLKAAAAYGSAIGAFLADLVRIPSVNGRDPEEAVARRVCAEAERLNIPCRLEARDSARPNVVAAIGAGTLGFALIGHLDTVAEGTSERWSHPPFAAEVAGGRLIGRGAADNKAGIACGLYTLHLLRERGLLDLSRQQVILAGVADEESGASSVLGARFLLERGLLPVQGAIYTYASDVVCIGHRGLLRLEITAEGQSIHAGSPEWHQHKAGANAVAALADLVVRLETLDVPAPSVPGFEHLGCTVTPGTLFHGGSYASIVPDLASMTVDIRLMPGQDADALMERIDRLFVAVERTRPGILIRSTVKVRLSGAAIPLDHPLVRIAQDWTERLTGRRWRAEGAGPANEGYMLIEKGIPILPGFGPTGGSAHAPDEWVSLASLPVTVAMYAGIIHEYLQISPSKVAQG